MMKSRGLFLISLARSALLLFSLSVFVEFAAAPMAGARIGGGRSVGRSSFGSRPPASAPRYANPPHESAPQAQPPQQPAPRSNGGGFMRGVAGGLAGGFLGSMLFNSLGQGGGMGGGGSGGGVGLFEILLFAGIAFFGYRWWKGRQQQPAAVDDQNSNLLRYGGESYTGTNSATPDNQTYRALIPMGIDPEVASDIFFKVQGAWTRRDLSSVISLIGTDLQETFEADLAKLRADHTINRLENITVRRTDVTRSWQEDNFEYSTVHFLANLLDYTVDERTNAVVAGDAAEPVKFEEDWTFEKRQNTNSWRLVGITQVN